MKKLIWMGVVSVALFTASTVAAEPVIATCDCKTETGKKGLSSSWEVDVEKETVDGKPATFSGSTIQWNWSVPGQECMYRREFSLNRYTKEMTVVHFFEFCDSSNASTQTHTCACELKKLDLSGRAL